MSGRLANLNVADYGRLSCYQPSKLATSTVLPLPSTGTRATMSSSIPRCRMRRRRRCSPSSKSTRYVSNGDGSGERAPADNRASAVLAYHASQGRVRWPVSDGIRIRHICQDVYYCCNVMNGCKPFELSRGPTAGSSSYSPVAVFY